MITEGVGAMTINTANNLQRNQFCKQGMCWKGEMFLYVMFLFFSRSCYLGEGEVAFFSAKRWDRRNTADLIEAATPCHDAVVVGSYLVLNPLRLTILTSKSKDYTTTLQHAVQRPNNFLIGSSMEIRYSAILQKLYLLDG